MPLHDVPDSDKRMDADAWPYTPCTRNIELPVEANTLGSKPLMEGATRSEARELLTAETLLLKSHKETTNRELPVRWGRRNAIAVSEAQTVEGHADA